MNETQQQTLDRLETRIEDQAVRIDALYGLLEQRGIVPRGTGDARGDAMSDDESETLDRSCDREVDREGRRRPAARRAVHFHLGEATGV